MGPPPSRKPRASSRFDLGKVVARLLCAIFALIGAIPLGGAAFLQSQPVEDWAARETTRLLGDLLGLTATFRVQMTFIPLELNVLDLRVPSTDSGSDAVRVDRVAISPRLFSLLAGRLDIGDIEVDHPQVRLRLAGGEIQNLRLQLPKSEPAELPELKHSPFRTFSLTGGSADITVDGFSARADALDVDVFAESGLAFDVSLRLAGAELRMQPPGQSGVFEDRLCGFDLRAHISETNLAIRRMSLVAAADLDPAVGTLPPCRGDPLHELAVRLSQAQVTIKDRKLVTAAQGRATVRVPAPLANRFVPTLPPAVGWAGVSAQVSYLHGMRLPEAEVHITGEGLRIGEYGVSEKLSAHARVSGDVIRVPRIEADWANGHGVLEGISFAPFAKGMPFEVARVLTKDMDFPGVMRDVAVTRHTVVDWHYDNVDLLGIKGHLDPFFIDAAFRANTSNFVVWNTGFDNPARKRMIGVKQSHLEGRVRVDPLAMQFYSSIATFGGSRIPVDFVSLGLAGPMAPYQLRLGRGVTVDLADITPIADIEVSGRAEAEVRMDGKMSVPSLDGTVSVKNFSLGGFELGDLSNTPVHFVPLVVKFGQTKGVKGDLSYTLPATELKFDGKAPIEFTSTLEADSFDVREFFRLVHFDEDPRFDEISGRGTATARIHYVFGGPDDTCGRGRLRIGSRLRMREFEAFGERYTPADAEFTMDWFDIDAGMRGLKMNIPSASLGKGTGTAYGHARIEPGAVIEGSIVATRLPVSRVDLLRPITQLTDGYVTGTAQVSGRLDALHIDAYATMSDLRTQGATLPPSNLHVEFLSNTEPGSQASFRSTGKLSGCGRPIPEGFSQAEWDADQSDGDIVLNGSLFGGQIALDDLRLSRQRDRRIRGRAHLNNLDIGSLATIGLATDSIAKLDGRLSGEVELTSLRPKAPFESDATFVITSADIGTSSYRARLRGDPARLQLGSGEFLAHPFAIEIQANNGPKAQVEAHLSLSRTMTLQAGLELKQTPLAAFGQMLPGVDRTDGSLRGGLTVRGSLSAPQYQGFVEVDDGKLFFKSYELPVTDLNIRLDATPAGLTVSRGTARFASGNLSFRGGAPLIDGRIGTTRLQMDGRNLDVPLGKDVRAQLATALEVAIPGYGEEGLPKLTGKVEVSSARYERDISVTADISTLTGRGKKSDVSDVDPNANRIEIDVLLLGKDPLVVKNDLVSAELLMDPAGVRIQGTDQRYGAQGTVQILPGGSVFLRRSQFEIQNGLLRFDDPSMLRPEVDVSAVTEFKRTQSERSVGNATTTSGSVASGAGNYRITLHAYGPPDDLKVDMKSDPGLAQEDIFLLLTVGLTHTELERTQSAGVGSAVALEALGSLSGAEGAVTSAVQVDEFRFGSLYSSRTGRSEPTVTIGKRLSERLRASVTTTLSEANEVRANLKYQATPDLSVEGSYDNQQRAGGPTVGNLGGDVRWRLEFD